MPELQTSDLHWCVCSCVIHAHRYVSQIVCACCIHTKVEMCLKCLLWLAEHKQFVWDTYSHDSALTILSAPWSEQAIMSAVNTHDSQLLLKYSCWLTDWPLYGNFDFLVCRLFLSGWFARWHTRNIDTSFFQRWCCGRFIWAQAASVFSNKPSQSLVIMTISKDCVVKLWQHVENGDTITNMELTVGVVCDVLNAGVLRGCH